MLAYLHKTVLFSELSQWPPVCASDDDDDDDDDDEPNLKPYS